MIPYRLSFCSSFPRYFSFSPLFSSSACFPRSACLRSTANSSSSALNVMFRSFSSSSPQPTSSAAAPKSSARRRILPKSPRLKELPLSQLKNLPLTPSVNTSSASESASSAPYSISGWPVSVTPLPRDSPSFRDLRVSSSLCNRLAESNFLKPTLIQTALIPWLNRRPFHALEFPDLIAQDHTGQGKTLAYLLPILSQIDNYLKEVQAIIVVPSRELAHQVKNVIDELSGGELKKNRLKNPILSHLLVGDVNPSMIHEVRKMKENASIRPQILIGTPRVLAEILLEHRYLSGDSLKYMVFDEIDSLLNKGDCRPHLLPLLEFRPRNTIKEKPECIQKAKEIEEMQKNKGGAESKKEASPASGISAETETEKAVQTSTDASPAQSRPASGAALNPFKSAGNIPVDAAFFEITNAPRCQILFLSASITGQVLDFAGAHLNTDNIKLITAASIPEECKRRGRPIDSLLPARLRHYYFLAPRGREAALLPLLKSIRSQYDSYLNRNQFYDPTFMPKNRKVSSLKGGAQALPQRFAQTTAVFFHSFDAIVPFINPLNDAGFRIGVITEKSTRSERRDALKPGACDVLLCTDVFSRGMDLKPLTHVIHYDFPKNPTVYLHRAGRVGRLNSLHAKAAAVISLVEPANPEIYRQLVEIQSKLGIQRYDKLYLRHGKLMKAQQKKLKEEIESALKDRQRRGETREAVVNRVRDQLNQQKIELKYEEFADTPNENEEEEFELEQEIEAGRRERRDERHGGRKSPSAARMSIERGARRVREDADPEGDQELDFESTGIRKKDIEP